MRDILSNLPAFQDLNGRKFLDYKKDDPANLNIFFQVTAPLESIFDVLLAADKYRILHIVDCTGFKIKKKLSLNYRLVKLSLINLNWLTSLDISDVDTEF